MSALLATGPTWSAAAELERQLAAAAPELVTGFREHLSAAADLVSRRLLGAAYREGLLAGASWSGDRVALPGPDGGPVMTPAHRHAFDRIELQAPLSTDPAGLLHRLIPAPGPARAVGVELADASVNLALALARRARLDADLADLGATCRDSLDLAAGLEADEQCLFFERLATQGHNLHPCGRTRLGWSAPDLLAHDLESPGTALAFVAVRREAHIGDDVPLVALPAGLDPARYTVTPVHIWQWHNVVRTRYADLIRDRSLVLLPEVMPAAPTAALRTLLLPPDAAGRRRYAKVSLDIQVTSTRRTISVASTRNGPVLSALVGRLLADTDAGDRVMLLAETAGCAVVAGEDRQRDLSAILRDGLTGRLDPGEVAVPGAALCARSPVTGTTVLAELVDRYARCRGLAPSPEPSRRAEAAAAFVIEYARLVLPPVLELATRHGIALEAHLQNCIPTFVDGVPHRLAVRDLAGIRIHPGRLRAGARSATGPLSAPVRLWPGSVVVTDDLDVMRAKLAYTALQAHLGEVVVSLTGSHGLAEAPAWAGVRSVVDEVYQRIGSADARGDHAFLTAPTVPHKALLRMRLAAVAGRPGDIYTRVENPLS